MAQPLNKATPGQHVSGPPKSFASSQSPTMPGHVVLWCTIACCPQLMHQQRVTTTTARNTSLLAGIPMPQAYVSMLAAGEFELLSKQQGVPLVAFRLRKQRDLDGKQKLWQFGLTEQETWLCALALHCQLCGCNTLAAVRLLGCPVVTSSCGCCSIALHEL